MTNTTPSEDRIAEACKQFGGKAAELVEALERIDGELSRALQRIQDLEEMMP